MERAALGVVEEIEKVYGDVYKRQGTAKIKITDCLYILAVCYFFNMRIFWKVKIIKKWNEKYIY